MNLALERLREKKKIKPLSELIAAQPVTDPLVSFFGEVAPAKPQLPPELQQFCYLHRMANTGAMPADKAAQVIEAIHDAADMLPNRNKRRLLLEARIEELQELSDWFLAWMPPQFEADEDPFDGI